MGQKVNPHGLRVGVINDWDSRWYVKDEEFGDTLVADYKLRTWLKDKLKNSGVPKECLFVRFVNVSNRNQERRLPY